MEQICGKFGHGILLVTRISRHPVTIVSTRKLMSGKYSRHCRPLLTSPQLRYFANPHCGYAMVVAKILREALKIRYILLGGTVYGGFTLKKKYEQWKEGLPNLGWIKNLMPNEKKWQDFRESLMTVKSSMPDKIEIDPRIKEFGVAKYREYRTWFDHILDDAIKAAESYQSNYQENSLIQSAFDIISMVAKQTYSGTKEQLSKIVVSFAPPLASDNTEEEESSQQRMNAMQDELMQMQLKYQREIEKLERENKELRKQPGRSSTDG